MGQLIYQTRYGLLALLFLIHCLAGWPGILCPDSMSQYNEAVRGLYTDHHPPIMAFFWHYLDLIHQGPGLLFISNLILLYGALAITLNTLKHCTVLNHRPWTVLFVLLAALPPQVSIYSFFIFKDIPFVFSFLMITSLLAYYTLAYRPVSWGGACIIFTLLVYGIGVKYQAQFCAIIVFIWLGLLWIRHEARVRGLLKLIAFSLAVYGSVTLIHRALVPLERTSHSWEWVKLYDLAAISTKLNQDLIPEENRTDFYTFEKLKERFRPNMVDLYIYAQDPLFKHAETEELRQHLWHTWAREVIKHPLIYLNHRITNLLHALLGRIDFDVFRDKISSFIGYPVGASKVLHLIVSGLGFLLLSQIWLMPLGVFYFFYALKYCRVSLYAQVLLGYTSIGLLLVGLIFFLSMAGVARYTYMLSVMVQASHIFALGLYWDLKKKKPLQKANGHFS